MDQMSFGDAGYTSKRKRTRRQTFLAEMEQVIPWSILLNLIEPFYRKAGNGRRSYPLKAMLKIHMMQNWFGLSDPAMAVRTADATPTAISLVTFPIEVAPPRRLCSLSPTR